MEQMPNRAVQEVRPHADVDSMICCLEDCMSRNGIPLEHSKRDARGREVKHGRTLVGISNDHSKRPRPYFTTKTNMEYTAKNL